MRRIHHSRRSFRGRRRRHRGRRIRSVFARRVGNRL
jgi:hypothetical protein